MKKSNRKILFRADSSSQIGLGHIRRDLVLAGQFRDDEILFACRDLEGHIMDKIPYPIIILSSMDVEELIMIVKQEQIDMLVIDHYGIRYEDEKRVKEATGVKIFVLDDTYERHYCDILLNHNISADTKRYKGLVPDFCELRCGAKYTLLRDEFKKEKGIQREKIYNVFVAMGGSDSANLNIPVLEALPQELKVCVVTTKANANLKRLEEYVSERANVSLFVNSNEVAKLMNQSRVAVITPSVTVHEVFYMELPFIAIKTADNQKEMYLYLQKEKMMVLREFDTSLLIKYLENEEKVL